MNKHVRYWTIGIILTFVILLIASFTIANWYKIRNVSPESTSGNSVQSAAFDADSLPSVLANRNLDHAVAESLLQSGSKNPLIP